MFREALIKSIPFMVRQGSPEHSRRARHQRIQALTARPGLVEGLIQHFLSKLKTLWRAVRRLSGDDAYERYLQHHTAHHHGETPLSKEAFFKQWQDEKWSGVKRCC